MANHKLLLADDSATIQKVVNLTFADEGVDVTCASDGDTAMGLFSQMHPDIVLADVHMPGLDGYHLCELIRQREESRDVPVILLVGSFEPFDEEEALRVGANDYLTKPFLSIRLLVTKVSELLAKRESQPEEPPSEIEVPAEHRAPYTGDIDDLIEQSFVETAEMPYPVPEPPRSDAAGLDDELIETLKPEAREDSSLDDHLIEVRHPSEIDEGTQEYHFEDAGGSFELPTSEAQAYVPASSPFDSLAAEEAVFEPESDESEDQWRPEAADDAAHGYEYDDSNLLELPDPRVRAEHDQPHAMYAERPELSPELIDAIARRVAEKISESVIREIAWQVVPQVADSIIRERTEGESRH